MPDFKIENHELILMTCNLKLHLILHYTYFSFEENILRINWCTI